MVVGTLESMFTASACPKCGSRRFHELPFCKACEHGLRFVCEVCGAMYSRAVECRSCVLLHQYAGHRKRGVDRSRSSSQT
jgi:predicted amidophosphoribosyltransferase